MLAEGVQDLRGIHGEDVARRPHEVVGHRVGILLVGDEDLVVHARLRLHLLPGAFAEVQADHVLDGLVDHAVHREIPGSR